MKYMIRHADYIFGDQGPGSRDAKRLRIRIDCVGMKEGLVGRSTHILSIALIKPAKQFCPLLLPGLWKFTEPALFVCLSRYTVTSPDHVQLVHEHHGRIFVAIPHLLPSTCQPLNNSTKLSLIFPDYSSTFDSIFRLPLLRAIRSSSYKSY